MYFFHAPEGAILRNKIVIVTVIVVVVVIVIVIVIAVALGMLVVDSCGGNISGSWLEPPGNSIQLDPLDVTRSLVAVDVSFDPESRRLFWIASSPAPRMCSVKRTGKHKRCKDIESNCEGKNVSRA